MRLTKAEIKDLRSLTQRKYREQEKKFLLEGWRALEEAVGSDFMVEMIAVSPAHRNPEENKILANAKKRSIQIKEISEKELGQVSSTVHSQGVVAVVKQREHSIASILSNKPSLVVALDEVGDPGNLGSIIRSCDWFRVDAVLLGKGSVELYNEKVLRSTVGSIFHLPIIEDVDLPSALANMRQSGYFVATLSGEGKESYTDGSIKIPAVFVFGSEAHGVSEEVRRESNSVLSIPKYGAAESLNVGVACGIVLAHLRAKG